MKLLSLQEISERHVTTLLHRQWKKLEEMFNFSGQLVLQLYDSCAGDIYTEHDHHLVDLSVPRWARQFPELAAIRAGNDEDEKMLKLTVSAPSFHELANLLDRE